MQKITMKEVKETLAGYSYENLVYFVMARYLDDTRNYNQHPEYNITINGFNYSCSLLNHRRKSFVNG